MIAALSERITDFFSKYEEKMADAPVWFQKLFGGETFWDFILNNGFQGFGIALGGWLVTTYFERRHTKELTIQESELQHISLSNNNKVTTPSTDLVLLTGSTILVHDIFRKFFITIRKIIGGNVVLYERLTMRARRSAILRMKEEANLRGIDHIINVRLDTVQVPGRFLSGIAVVAYGTGVKETLHQ
ncbi:MAG: YbjQ family protein [Kordiimonas sp.]